MVVGASCGVVETLMRPGIGVDASWGTLAAVGEGRKSNCDGDADGGGLRITAAPPPPPPPPTTDPCRRTAPGLGERLPRVRLRPRPRPSRPGSRAPGMTTSPLSSSRTRRGPAGGGVSGVPPASAASRPLEESAAVGGVPVALALQAGRHEHGVVRGRVLRLLEQPRDTGYVDGSVRDVTGTNRPRPTHRAIHQPDSLTRRREVVARCSRWSQVQRWEMMP